MELFSGVFYQLPLFHREGSHSHTDGLDYVRTAVGVHEAHELMDRAVCATDLDTWKQGFFLTLTPKRCKGDLLQRTSSGEAHCLLVALREKSFGLGRSLGPREKGCFGVYSVCLR